MSTDHNISQSNNRPTMAEKGRIVILGAGESGVGAAMLAQKQGFEVFVSDFGGIAERYKSALQELNVSFEEKQHTEELILNATEVIKSPGIPATAPIVKALVKKKIPVISEIEFAKRYTKSQLVIISLPTNKRNLIEILGRNVTKEK